MPTIELVKPSVAVEPDARERFYSLVPELLREDQRLAVVVAEIGKAQLLDRTPPDLHDRLVNVGIREQLMVSVAGGLALSGLRPIVHSFPPFLVERPFEQVKLDLDHQDVGAVLVSAGGSYGWPAGGETHFGQRDVALLDTLSDWTVHVPGHPDEAELLIRDAVRGDDRVYVRLDNRANDQALATADGRMRVLRQGQAGTVIAVGPMLGPVLEATRGRDVTVLYAATVRPFDAETLVRTLSEPDVLLVEPYLSGTSVSAVSGALRHVRSRVVGLGVKHHELRRYGTVEDHDRAHGLDPAGIRHALDELLALA